MKKNILHIAPHHDDIFLGYYPIIKNKLFSDDNYFLYLTSGINAISNKYIIKYLNFILKNKIIIKEKIDNISKQLSYDIFTKGFKSSDKKIIKISKAYNILNTILLYKKEKNLKIDIFKYILQIKKGFVNSDINNILADSIKRSIREFEAETLWLQTKIPLNNIIHLDLPFYYNHNIQKTDSDKLLNHIQKIKPDIIYMISDPKYTGPKTHYMSLQLFNKTIKRYTNKPDIIYYKNVWSIFNRNEANLYYPVDKEDIKIMKKLFTYCFESQVKALFPSKIHKGNFAEIVIKLWKNNLNFIDKNNFPSNSKGIIFLKLQT